MTKKKNLSSPYELEFKHSKDTLECSKKDSSGQYKDKEKYEECVAFCVASICGDASMKAKESRLCIEQEGEEYSQWKKDKAFELSLASGNDKSKLCSAKRTRENADGTFTKTTSYRFWTYSYFGTWHPFFYRYKQPGDPTYNPQKENKRRKLYPVQLHQWFKHPLALAIFYMDDGGVQDNQPYFATGEVTFHEVEIMRSVLLKNFDLECTYRYKKCKNLPQGTDMSPYVFLSKEEDPEQIPRLAVGLLVKRESCSRFLDIVSPIIQNVPSMRYKLEITRTESTQ